MTRRNNDIIKESHSDCEMYVCVLMQKTSHNQIIGFKNKLTSDTDLGAALDSTNKRFTYERSKNNHPEFCCNMACALVGELTGRSYHTIWFSPFT